MRIVVALGANALLEPGDTPDAMIERRHVRRAARALAQLAQDHHLVVCYGNGPQLDQLGMENQNDDTLTRPYPLDAIGAQTQGMIGYWLAQELRNAGVVFPIVSMMTQTVVDASDPSFDAPVAFVGARYSKHHANRLAWKHGWTVRQDGESWRRCVPSPQPDRIVEIAAIHRLVDDGTLVICGGGGGLPVIETDSGELAGVDAVVDKDLTASLIASELNADLLLVLTDVDAVMRDFGTAKATPIKRIDVVALRELQFPERTMSPKIKACDRFVRSTAHRAAIGALEDAAAIVAGTAGTTIVLAPHTTALDLPYSAVQ
jgi:carbamate kinase